MSDINDIFMARLDRIEAKTDKLIDGQSALLVQVAENTITLAEHQRRSLANEELVILAKRSADDAIAVIKSELKPLTAKHEAKAIVFKWFLAGVGVASSLITAAFGLAKFFKLA